MSNPGDNQRFVADGNFFQRQAMIAAGTAGKTSQLNLRPIFQRWLVVDVIFDPYIIDDSAVERLKNAYKDTPIKNLGYAQGRTLPRNTIIAKPIVNLSQGSTVGINELMFLYPFFPSSLALPCKPGEQVWVLFEYLTQNVNIGYWVCSITGPGEVEDVNHSHFPRQIDANFIQNKNDADKFFQDEYGANASEPSKLKPRYHFKDGNYFLQDQQIFERILSSSQGSLASVYESVPRFRKRPGDIALEGSNNTLIVLGRDRPGPVATYDESGSVDFNDSTLKKYNAGSIDIVAGRGQITGPDQTGGVPIVNDLKNLELSKHRTGDSTGNNEGNPDFKNDRSRIYVSQNTNVDNNLSISGYNNNIGIQDNQKGDAGIIIKSDKIRIFARSDVQILVTGYKTDVLPTGASQDSNRELTTSLKTENVETTNFASITIKSNGDIVFNPSSEGYIKLGGDDADRGIVCTATPVVATGGIVIGNPLLTSMGGQFAGAAGGTQDGPNTPGIAAPLGTFSNKVLIK